MSHSLYVHFDRDVGRLDPTGREHVFASNIERLNRYATGRGLRPLGDFVVDLEAVDEDLDSPDDWFDAHDVQHAAEALAASASDDPPSFVEREGHTAGLLADLNSIAMLARRAAEAGGQVRLTVQEVV